MNNMKDNEKEKKTTKEEIINSIFKLFEKTYNNEQIKYCLNNKIKEIHSATFNVLSKPDKEPPEVLQVCFTIDNDMEEFANEYYAHITFINIVENNKITNKKIRVPIKTNFKELLDDYNLTFIPNDDNIKNAKKVAVNFNIAVHDFFIRQKLIKK